MKMPRNCPWCGAEFQKKTGKDMRTVLGTVYYECGTIVTVYAAFMQVTTPCTEGVPQWVTREEFFNEEQKEGMHN